MSHPTQEDPSKEPPTDPEQRPDRKVALAPGAQVPTDVYFPEERSGWHGYVEWEDYPEKRAKAEAILKHYDFPPVSLAI